MKKMKARTNDEGSLISGVDTERRILVVKIAVRKEILEFNHKEHNIITRGAQK
jgi:hypothetical protein